MDPIPLKPDFSDSPVPVNPSEGPTVWLSRLRDVDIPEEGEIRFRYSRKKKVETETRADETCDYELCLKAITDICDCADKEPDGMDDPDAAMDRLAEDLKDEDLVDESEDDNPSKY